MREVRSLADGVETCRTILESMETASGRLLPIVESHVRFAEGGVISTASVVRTYSLVGDVQVPESVKEVTHGSPASTTRTLTFGRVEMVR